MSATHGESEKKITHTGSCVNMVLRHKSKHIMMAPEIWATTVHFLLDPYDV